MGAFYGSIHVRTQDRDRVLRAADAVAGAAFIKCLVGPAIDGWVGIYPEGSGQDYRVGNEIAHKISGFVLHLLIHDDDVMAYWLWRDGELLDGYFSSPGYFDESDREIQSRMSGNPGMFLPILGEDANRLKAILDREIEISSETSRLKQFAALLGIANAMTSYEHLKLNQTKGIQGWRQFIEAPRDAVAIERSEKAARRKKAAARIEQLKRDGILLAYERRENSADIHNVADGFLVHWRFRKDDLPPLEFYAKPWITSEQPPLGEHGFIAGLESTEDSRFLLVSEHTRTTVWTVETNNWRLIRTLPEPVHSSRFAPDGSSVFHFRDDSIVLIDLASGTTREIRPATSVQAAQFAIHPTSRWIATAGTTLTLIPLRKNLREKTLCIGGEVCDPPQAQMIRDWIEDKPPAKLEEEFRKNVDQLRNKNKRLPAADFELQLGALEKQLAESIERWKALQRGELDIPVRGIESVLSLGFSRDGRFLWCGTDKGLRVYAWPEILETRDRDDPPAVYDFEPPDDGYHSQLIYAIAEEPDGAGLIFGGMNGRLYRMDLKTGNTREIMALPDERIIFQLCFSADGMALGIVSGFSEQKHNLKTRTEFGCIEIWSYPEILKRQI